MQLLLLGGAAGLRLAAPPPACVRPNAQLRRVRPPKLKTASDTDADVVVIGSGLGGLSCAALLARYGYSVVVCESHSIPGGCAHSFERAGYTFDSGPSLWSGCASASPNPLRSVLDAIGESPEWKQYDGWVMYTPEGDFYAKSGDVEAWKETISQFGGAKGSEDWERLTEFIEPLGRAVTALPPLALRADLGVVWTAAPWLGRMADPRIGLRAGLLSGPWSAVLRAARVENTFLSRCECPRPPEPTAKSQLAGRDRSARPRHAAAAHCRAARAGFDFLAFAFSGLPSDGTVAAAMVYMLSDFYSPGAKMDYPVGGSGAVVDALVRGLTKRGGELRLRVRRRECPNAPAASSPWRV